MNELVNDHFKVVDPEAHITYDGHTYLVFEEKDIEFKQEQEDLRHESKQVHHINFYTMRRFIELIDEIKEPLIVETGTSATLVKSSHLFDKYIFAKGGDFITVDINPGAAYHFSKDVLCPKTKYYTSDSVQFLQNLDKVSPRIFYQKIKLIVPQLKKNKTKAIFFKAWNEWAEGNVIENSEKYGDDFMICLKKIKKLFI